MRARSPHSPRRPGKILLMTGLLLPVLLGMVGLVIDCGLMMAARRQAQNAADAAAIAAGRDKFIGLSNAVALASANALVAKISPSSPPLAWNAGAANAVNLPPQSGPYSTGVGGARYTEAVVTIPYRTLFLQSLGLASNRPITARAVAGYESLDSGEGVIVLDPRGNATGLSVTGGAVLKVNGAVLVNTRGKGYDQYGDAVPTGFNQYALATGNNSAIFARMIRVAGGVDVLENIYNFASYPDYSQSSRKPLYAGLMRASSTYMMPDPMASISVPTTASLPPGYSFASKGSFSFGTGQTGTLTPGVYEDISITGSASVQFAPGVYILRPTQPNQGLRINGSPTVVGTGVMFYFTGSNYLSTNPPGAYEMVDNTTIDPATLIIPDPPDPQFHKVNFASLNINVTSGSVTLNGLAASSPGYRNEWDNLLFNFRRRIGATGGAYASISGGGGDMVKLGGTIYAKWSAFALSGGSSYDAQFIVGTMAVSGQTVMTINAVGQNTGLDSLMYLVE